MRTVLTLILLCVLSACATDRERERERWPDVYGKDDVYSKKDRRMDDFGGFEDGEPGAEKVHVCHKGRKTLYIAVDAADAHLDHGDRPGHC